MKMEVSICRLRCSGEYCRSAGWQTEARDFRVEGKMVEHKMAEICSPERDGEYWTAARENSK